jgi:GntR family transcriptional regulator / MocR family aminotransferase
MAVMSCKLSREWFPGKVHLRVSAVDHFAPQVLVGLDREATVPLRAQIERQLRAGIREGRLHPGTRLPSSRALAERLGVARGVVVEAYAQLAAEGWLVARQGSGTQVAPAVTTPAADPEPWPFEHAHRYDFALGVPDLAAFPRAAWLAAMRRVLRSLPDAQLSHPDPRGAGPLRAALSGYLGRVRGVVTTPDRVVICTGFWQGLDVVCRALAARGARRIAMEDPSFLYHRMIVKRAGLEPVPIPVDEAGLRVELVTRARVDAALITPAHQSPTGVVLAPERRTAIMGWAEEHDTIVIEDDYDAEHRYDRDPIGALQGLSPERVVYGGTASKTLAPALRLGWVVVPSALAHAVATEKAMADGGSPVLEQLVLADLIERGDLDRHLRRTRAANRRRRDALEAALREHLPDARVHGVAAGLHAAVELPAGVDEGAVVAAAAARGVRVEGIAAHRFDRLAGPPALLLGYGALSEAAIRRGVRELASAVADATRG